MKCPDDLIENGLLELEGFRRGKSDDAKYRVSVDDVDRHAVPLGAVHNARKGPADGRLTRSRKTLT